MSSFLFCWYLRLLRKQEVHQQVVVFVKVGKNGKLDSLLLKKKEKSVLIDNIFIFLPPSYQKARFCDSCSGIYCKKHINSKREGEKNKK